MRGWLAAAALLAAQLPTADAWACLPLGDRAANTADDNAVFAEAMVRQATYVEVVEVQRATTFADPELWRRWLDFQISSYNGAPQPSASQYLKQIYERRRVAPAGVRYDLRVVRRLKGDGSDLIQMDGGLPSPPARRLFHYVATDDPSPPLQHWVGKTGNSPFTFLEPSELGPHNLTQGSSCDAASISFLLGGRYLLFRGRDGHLLGPIQFKGVQKPALGYRKILLTPGGPQDWLFAVDRAAKSMSSGSSHRAPSQTTRSGRQP